MRLRAMRMRLTCQGCMAAPLTCTVPSLPKQAGFWGTCVKPGGLQAGSSGAGRGLGRRTRWVCLQLCFCHVVTGEQRDAACHMLVVIQASAGCVR